MLFQSARDNPFKCLHDTSIRREGAEAMAADYARIASKALADLRDPDLHGNDRKSIDFELCMLECYGENQALLHDAAQAILPFLSDVPDAVEKAMKIAAARPWEMPGRDRPADPPSQAADGDDDLPF